MQHFLFYNIKYTVKQTNKVKYNFLIIFGILRYTNSLKCTKEGIIPIAVLKYESTILEILPPFISLFGNVF
jgi:hypothetical protein